LGIRSFSTPPRGISQAWSFLRVIANKNSNWAFVPVGALSINISNCQLLVCRMLNSPVFHLQVISIALDCKYIGSICLTTDKLSFQISFVVFCNMPFMDRLSSWNGGSTFCRRLMMLCFLHETWSFINLNFHSKHMIISPTTLLWTCIMGVLLLPSQDWLRCVICSEIPPPHSCQL